MTRGKQAAAAANRRADAAEEKVTELKERLAAERAEWDAREKQYKADIGQLRESLSDRAASLAADEITRLSERVSGLLAEKSAVEEQLQESAKARDYLIRNMARYLSMRDGVPPARAVAIVVTWLTNETYGESMNADQVREKLDLPHDSWCVTELRMSESVQPTHGVVAHSLNEVDAHPEQFDVHPSYNAFWYEMPPAPRLGRKSKGVFQTRRYTPGIMPQRAPKEIEKETP